MNMLEALLGEVLSGLVNSGLALDPTTAGELQTLEGCALRLELVLPPQAIVLRVTGGALRVQPGSEYPAQTMVRGSIQDLIALLRGRAPSTQLQISGDPALLARFERLFRGFNPDLDGLVPAGMLPGNATANSALEQWLGLLEEGLDSARRAATGFGRQSRAQVDTLVRDELMTKDDLIRLESELDALRLQLDRVQARLALAESAEESAEESGTAASSGAVASGSRDHP